MTTRCRGVVQSRLTANSRLRLFPAAAILVLEGSAESVPDDRVDLRGGPTRPSLASDEREYRGNHERPSAAVIRPAPGHG